MAEGRIKNTELSAIAAAIRSKNGESTVYKPAEMAQAILDIPAGGSAVIESKSITANGTYNAPTGVDGYNPVIVAVQPNLQSKTATENGTVTADSGYDGLSSVEVNVGGASADYYYFDNEGGTLGVKISSDGTFKWYFNGYTKGSGDVTIADSTLKAFMPGAVRITAAYASDKTTQLGWIGFYTSDNACLIRTWTMNQGSLLSGTFWGTLNVTAYDGNPAAGGTITPYEEPPTQ